MKMLNLLSSSKNIGFFRRLIFGLSASVVLLTLGLLTAPQAAQVPGKQPPITSPQDSTPVDSTTSTFKIKNSYLKLDSHLSQLVDVFRAKGLTESEKYAEALGLTVKEGAVFVQIAIEEGHSSTELDKSVLQLLNVNIIAASSDLVDAWVPIGKLLDLADKQATIRRIQRPSLPMSEDSEGLGLVGARMYLDRQPDHFQGQDIPIAVVDVGFDRYNDADLPDNLRVQDFTGQGIGGNLHGTSTAEIVSDFAPRSSLYLLKVNSRPTLESALNYARDHQVKIVSMSLGWKSPEGDYFAGQDLMSQLVNRAFDNGIFVVVSAGNHARMHYRGNFSDNGGNGHFHRFANVGTVDPLVWYVPNSPEVRITQRVQNVGQDIWAYLTWNAFPRTNRDFDIYLERKVNNQWQDVRDQEGNLVGGHDFQLGNEPPVESFWYRVQSQGEYGLLVQYWGTNANARYVNEGNVNIPDYVNQRNGEARQTIAVQNAPQTATLTGVEIEWGAVHNYHSDLYITMTTQVNQHGALVLWNRQGGNNHGALGAGLSTMQFNGERANQAYYLNVQDRAAEDVGQIDYFRLKLYYRYYENLNNVNLTVFTDGPGLESNTPAGSVTIPALAEKAFTVGAINRQRWAQNINVENYSSLGPTYSGRTKPNMCGPTFVSTSFIDNFNGTSAAAPHVAGAAALMLSAKPNMTAAQLRDGLQANAVAIGQRPNNTFGYGKLKIGLPNLRLTAASATPNRLRAGRQTQVRYTVADADWNATAFSVAAFWSSDQNLSNDDVRLGDYQRENNGLNAGASVTRTINRTIPNNAQVRQAPYYVLVYADCQGQLPTGEVVESNDNAADNILAIPITVSQQMAPEDEGVNNQISSNSNSRLSDLEVELPRTTSLGEPFPNPFNLQVSIPYTLSVPSLVKISIYDILGSCVTTLVNRQARAGAYTANWNADGFAGGVYLIRFSTESHHEFRKVVFVK